MNTTGRKHPTSRVTADSQSATNYLAGAFLQWIAERNIAFAGAPPVVVVAAYLAERAAGTWKPARSTAKGGLKFESLRHIPSALVDYYRREGHAVDHLVDSEVISNLIRNFQVRLPVAQVASRRALPLTEQRIAAVEAFLRSLVEAALVHPVWALRWIAILRTAQAAGLRPSELVRIRFAWISRAMTSKGPGYLISIPYSKHHNEPRTVCLSPALPGGAEAVAAMDEWMSEAGAAGYRFTKRALLFPVVLSVGGESSPRGASVADRSLAEFPHLVAELDVELDVKATPAGSNRTVAWRCKQGHRWTARIFNRTARGSGCSKCFKVCKSLGDVPRPSDGVVFTNPIDPHLADSNFHTGESLSMRTGHAVGVAAAALAKTYTAICKAAGLEARNDLEGVTANGPRRGGTVELTRAGFDRQVIARHLRHAHPDVSIPYIEEQDLEPTTALSDLPGWSE